MLLSCDCLNITINTRTKDFTSFDVDLKDSFTLDSFFNEDLALLYLCSSTHVTIHVPSLMRERKSGTWKIVRCVNCSQQCYGTNKSLGMGTLLVRKNLQKDENQFNSIRQNKLYSPIFKIIIYNVDAAPNNELDSNTYLYPPAHLWLSEQTALAEDRVKMFTETEYAALDELKRRAYKDQQAIIRKELDTNSEDPKEKKSSLINTVPTAQSTNYKEPNLKKSPEHVYFEEPSADSEGVFQLEGFEIANANRNRNYESESEGSESESENDVYIPRKIGISQLAKSLPIPVPQFMEEKHQNEHLNGSPQAPSDIAASIKALAKSVHGDAIFGELPKPRFSTHL